MSDTINLAEIEREIEGYIFDKKNVKVKVQVLQPNIPLPFNVMNVQKAAQVYAYILEQKRVKED